MPQICSFLNGENEALRSFNKPCMGSSRPLCHLGTLVWTPSICQHASQNVALGMSHNGLPRREQDDCLPATEPHIPGLVLWVTSPQLP